MTLVSRTGRQLQRYNPNGHRLVVGCIPYRYKGSCKNGTEVEVLVISSQKAQGKGMMFPKGGWELDESVEEAAHRESLEEAGVLGSLEGELGTWSYKSKSHDTIYEGCMFSLLVEEQLDLWPEKNVRQRLWMTVEEAAKEVCGHWWMKEALDVLIQRLAAPKTHGLWQPERKEVRDSHTTKFTNKAEITNIELLELRSLSAGINED